MIKGLLKTILLVLFLLQPVYGWSQETETATKVVAPLWVAPDISRLPVNWWAGFFTEDVEDFRSRAELLTAKVNEYISGLDADNLVIAQTSADALKTNLDAVLALHSLPAPEQRDALPTYDSYSLQQLFELKKLERETNKQLNILDLEQQQLKRQSQSLVQKRDLNFSKYGGSDPSSPARLLTGLKTINIQLELYVARKQLDNKAAQQTRVKNYLGEVSLKIKYAADHLTTGELGLLELDSGIQVLNGEITSAKRKLAAVQHKLLNATKTENPDTYEILNLKQQLTLVSVEELLAQLKLALAYAKRDWYLLRSGTTTSTLDLHKSDPVLTALINEATQQSDLWTDASQNTLITPAPEKDHTAQKAYSEAQSNAHQSLGLIAEINATLDNLSLVQDRVSSESLTLEQGLSGLWLRVKLFSQGVMTKSRALVDISLFRTSDHPVTIGSIVKALLVFLFFWAMSWLIRHFLNRLERRQHFQQGSFYAGGRVLHYVILTIAVIAALGSIGLDFSSFALVAGALSVGIGFGLQSVVLNFVSGLILLFEGSIRVGDYVQLDSSDAGARLMGVVKEIRSRATMISTNDNVDVIVPNSELVGNRMVNWTLKESTARMRIPFSVAYGSDKELVQKAALEASEEGEFCIHHTPGYHPAVRMISFGDSALNFELRVWVNRQGVRRPASVRSSILWAMDTRFREYGIEVPFPQRDIHLPGSAGLMNPKESIESG